MKKIKVNMLTIVRVNDPDTGNVVDVTIFKMATGGIIGIDSSYLENTEEPVYSPFDKNIELDLED